MELVTQALSSRDIEIDHHVAAKDHVEWAESDGVADEIEPAEFDRTSQLIVGDPHVPSFTEVTRSPFLRETSIEITF